MANYFEVKVTYDKVMENGMVKKTTEPFLFDALTFSEAEGRAIEELTPYISGDFSVKACKRTTIAEVFNLEAERFYLAKVGFITIDEATNIEKRKAVQIVVGAPDFETAYEELKEGMKGTMTDWEVLALSETPIVDIYPVKLTKE